MLVRCAQKECMCLSQGPLTSQEAPSHGDTHVQLCVSPPTAPPQAMEKEVSDPKTAFELNSTICSDTLASRKHRATVNSKSLGVAVQQGAD